MGTPHLGLVLWIKEHYPRCKGALSLTLSTTPIPTSSVDPGLGPDGSRLVEQDGQVAMIPRCLRVAHGTGGRGTSAIGLVDGERTLAVRSYLECVIDRLDAELHILIVGAQEQPTKLGAVLARKSRKSLLIDRYGQRCQGCGQPKSENDLEVDHIKPKSAGGPDAIQNRTLLCRPCNQLKSDELTLDELRQRCLEDGLMDSDWWKEREHDRTSSNTSASVFGEVYLAEWGGKLRVRALTGPEKCILWKLRRGFGPRKYEPGGYGGGFCHGGRGRSPGVHRRRHTGPRQKVRCTCISTVQQDTGPL